METGKMVKFEFPIKPVKIRENSLFRENRKISSTEYNKFDKTMILKLENIYKKVN